MTTLFDDRPATPDVPAPTDTPTETRRAAETLRQSMLALRLSFTWFGTRKTLSNEQKAQAAESFGADGQVLSAGKRLIDTKYPAFKAVTAVRSRTVQFWKSISLPFPEAGIRLIRHTDATHVDERFTALRDELLDAVQSLDEHYRELKETARTQLSALYDERDYPASLQGLFGLSWDYPSVEPPPYLERLSPELYQRECERVQARFDEAVHLAEQAFMDELSKLVEHLSERLSGETDGRPKVFRDSAVNNLTEFFDRFRDLNVRSNEQLDELVERASRIVRGVAPQVLRDNGLLRQQVATQLSTVQSALDGLLIDRPRRNIMRGSR